MGELDYASENRGYEEEEQMINDNSNNPNWPESEVVLTLPMYKTVNDAEPHQQLICLSCGHYCFNTWGFIHEVVTLNQKFRCRTCGLKNE